MTPLPTRYDGVSSRNRHHCDPPPPTFLAASCNVCTPPGSTAPLDISPSLLVGRTLSVRQCTTHRLTVHDPNLCHVPDPEKFSSPHYFSHRACPRKQHAPPAPSFWNHCIGYLGICYAHFTPRCDGNSGGWQMQQAATNVGEHNRLPASPAHRYASVLLYATPGRGSATPLPIGSGVVRCA